MQICYVTVSIFTNQTSMTIIVTLEQNESPRTETQSEYEFNNIFYIKLTLINCRLW